MIAERFIKANKIIQSNNFSSLVSPSQFSSFDRESYPKGTSHEFGGILGGNKLYIGNGIFVIFMQLTGLISDVPTGHFLLVQLSYK